MSIAEKLERADLRSYIRFGIQSYPTSSPKIHVISCYDFGRCLARCEFPEARYPIISPKLCPGSKILRIVKYHTVWYE